MCSPVAMGIMSLAGGVMQGMGAAQQLEAQAQTHANNAEVARMEQMETHIAGAYQMSRLMDEAKRIGGANRAAVAEGGLAMSGSAADVVLDTEREIALDHDAIRFNSDIEQGHLQMTRETEMKSSADARAALCWL